MKLVILGIATLLVAFSIAASAAAPDATTGSISGTIALATGDTHGPAYIPAGSVIDVRVGYVSGNPAAPHVIVTSVTHVFVASPGGSSIPFAVTGLDIGSALDVEAEVHALNDGPHAWSAALTRVDAAKGKPVALTREHPHADGIAFSAAGIVVPPTATADGFTPLGSIGGFVSISASKDRPLPDALPTGNRVIAYAASDPAAAPIASASLGKLSSYDGRRASAYFHLTGLPIDTVLAIRVVSPDGVTPAFEYRATQSPGENTGSSVFSSAGDAWHATLSFERRNVNLSTLFIARPVAPSSAPSSSPT